MLSGDHIRQSFSAALPIMLGYVAIGIPCGILSASIGMNELQVFLLSAVFYSGAGQFMIPNMWLGGRPPPPPLRRCWPARRSRPSSPACRW